MIYVGIDVAKGNLVDGRRSLRFHTGGIDECIETTTAFNLVEASSQCTFRICKFLLYSHYFMLQFFFNNVRLVGLVGLV